ncbi:MAG: GAF domain-containing protein [Actinobacteria bacterium]|nr:GAF domain-containing protein [Actinomycetota bacterium]
MGGSIPEDGARAAIEHLLRAAHRHLGMEAAFLAELTETQQLYRATSDETASFTILSGGSLPRLESFCQHVLTRNAPWVVPDTREDPTARALAITETGRFGAYIGVPVRLLDGTVFGTLCCISHDACPGLGDRDVHILEALADVLAFHATQMRDAGEQLRGLRSGTVELADRLRSQETRLGLLSEVVRGARTPTIVFDPVSLRVDYCNDAAATLLGKTPGDVLGTPLWQHTRRWTEAGMREELGRVLGDGPPTRSFETEVPETGQVFDVLVQRITTGSGEAAVLLTAHDVTEHRRSSERLEQALAMEQEAGEGLRRLDSMRNAFLTAVSHELRTPLTIVRLAAETLSKGRAAPDLAQQLLERMMSNADRLDRLLGDLLDLNQFSHGQLRLVREEVALDELVREALAQVELDDHELVLELEPVSAVVARTKVERIVVNLVVNASVHTGSGTITVRLAREGEAAILSVEDEGAGVAEQDREVLFEPFRQGETAPSHRPGTGIGLSLVAAFAELHGGRAWIDEAPGGGAAFRVLLPTAAQD